MRRFGLFSLLCVLAALSPLESRADSGCTPLVPVPADSVLRLDSSSLAAFPRLVGTLSRDVTLPVAGSLFGLKRDAQEAVLGHAVTVPGQILGGDVLVGNRAELLFEVAQPTQVTVDYAGRRLLMQIDKNGNAQELAGNPVTPLLISTSTFVVSEGARVRNAGPSNVTIAAGSKLTWRLDNASQLPFVIQGNARLEETSPSSSAALLDVIHPPRVLPGARMKIRVTAPEFDFDRDPFTVCFVLPSAQKTTYSIPATGVKLISREGGVATIEARVPLEFARTRRDRQTTTSDRPSWYDKFFGVATTMRFIGSKGGRVVVDETQTFSFSNAIVAGSAGLCFVLALLILTAVMVRVRSGRSVMGVFLIKRNRYSLSNLQVVIWTMLALFAMVYMWIGTGILFAIPQEFLILLGISGVTSVLARAVEKKDDATLPPARKPMLRDLLMGEDGEFELLRFQMLGFTLFTAFYSLQSVLLTEGLPQLPESLLVLMGVSSATYLGGKLPDKLGSRTDDATDMPLELPTEQEKALSRDDIDKLQTSLRVPATGILDAPTREAVRRFKTERSIMPIDGKVNPLLIRSVLSAAR